MARKPNYGQNRADVNRAKQARKEAKLEALKDAVARRKSGEDPLDDEAGAFSSEAEALSGSENATTVAGAFSSEAESLSGSEKATIITGAFSSEAESLGSPEIETKEKS